MKVILDRELEQILSQLDAVAQRAFCRKLTRWANQLHWQGELARESKTPPPRRRRSPKPLPEVPAMLLRRRWN